MKLEESLKDPKKSVVREKLLKHKFLYDVQLSFLTRGQQILYYESDYDVDGFDLLFDNLGSQKHVQMKSVLSSSTTNRFSIHRTLLRPKIEHLNYYPLSPDGFGAGYGGGVVLIEAHVNKDNLEVSYKYCDGLILTAFATGYFRYKNISKQNAVLRTFNEFQNPQKIGGQISLSKSCFIEFKSIISLFDYLSLAGYG